MCASILSVDLVLWAETLRDSNFETDQMLVFALGKDKESVFTVWSLLLHNSCRSLGCAGCQRLGQIQTKGPALSRLSADQFFLGFFVSTCF